jgi:Ca2+-binding EF-hand superfamily protein
MKKQILLSAFPLLAAVLSSCQTTGDRFSKIDTNHDGKLSSDEASDYYVGNVFTSRDHNHDGKLTWQEWHVAGSNDSKARFDAADTNKDGGLSIDEAKAYARHRGVFAESFRKADANHDGFVTRAEGRAFYARTEGPPR